MVAEAQFVFKPNQSHCDSFKIERYLFRILLQRIFCIRFSVGVCVHVRTHRINNLSVYAAVRMR